ncbi:E motif [Dillenia turbinata]|uniref:E motif n=1 Tax=Dillenia turbinata TaxID=194707 RepID=A0AAN8UPM6_9MAGN
MPSFSLSPPSQILTKFKQKPTNSSRPCIVQSVLNLCSQGRIREAVDCLELLPSKGLHLDSKSLAFLIQQCGSYKSVKEGKRVHLYIKLATCWTKPRILLVNNLINMYFKFGDDAQARKLFDKMSVRNLYSWNNMLAGYAKLGMIKPAKKLFDKMPEKDVVSWNTMIIAYARNGYYNNALRFYGLLRNSGLGFNAFSFAGVLSVCVKVKDVGLTRQVHCQVIVSGFPLNVVLLSSVVDAYAKSGEMRDARKLFDEMKGRDILAWTTLVSGYAKWGDLKSARELFDVMPEKNSVSWTALIAGYARHGMGYEALELFTRMVLYRVTPDQFTFSSCLCACASISSLRHGKQIHCCLIRTGFRPNTIVVSSLIDMYSKCANLELGRRVFDLMAYVLLSSIYGSLGKWDAVAKVRKLMNERQVKKQRAVSWVEIGNEMHSFSVSDGSHPLKQEIYLALEQLAGQIEDEAAIT